MEPFKNEFFFENNDFMERQEFQPMWFWWLFPPRPWQPWQPWHPNRPWW